MRTVAALLAGLAAIVMTQPTPAKAETQYPWCAHFSDGSGVTSCGFDSSEQCEINVRGMGGYCDKNLTYQAPVAAPIGVPAAPPSAAPMPQGRKVAALTAKEKMKTCQFGADDQKLAGAARTKFISRCMTNKDDPRGPAPAPK
jgi:hypothetical protein